MKNEGSDLPGPRVTVQPKPAVRRARRVIDFPSPLILPRGISRQYHCCMCHAVWVAQVFHSCPKCDGFVVKRVARATRVPEPQYEADLTLTTDDNTLKVPPAWKK
jgi:hypothetical protein